MYYYYHCYFVVTTAESPLGIFRGNYSVGIMQRDKEAYRSSGLDENKISAR